MATAESPVSESKIKCDGTEETAEKIKGDLGANIGSLIEAIKEVQGVCSEFDKEYFGKIPREPEIMRKLRGKLNKTVDKLGEELKKAISEDVAIVFVGRTSSGKSSLINALFRNDFLPVTAVQTTMCKIQVRPTADEWSVDQVGCEKPLLNQPRGREDVVAFLKKISEVTNSAEREELNIDSHSVIQVKSPHPHCILPKNIVLIDTPGSKENPDGDEVVLDSCKEADILVAVINVGSPSIHEIAGLLNKVNCQFKFGVFTKWDKVVREKEEGKRQQVREKDEGEFQSFVNGKCMVYFVDAKHVTKEKETSAQANDARNDFLRFETDLAQSAKSVKAQKDMNLIERAEDLTSEHNEDFEEIKSILERREEYIDNHLNKIEGEICTLNEKKCSLKAVDQEAKKLIDLIRPRLREGENNKLIQELSNNIKSCPTVESENEVIDAFKKMIDGINTALQLQSEKVEKEYQERKDNLRSFQTNFPQQFLPPYEATLKDFSYSSLTDPYAYVTRDNFWRFALGCAAGTVAAAAAAASAPTLVASAAASFAATNTGAVAAATTAGATAGATAGVTTPALVKKLSGSGIGQAIRRRFGPSERKVNSIKEWARENLMVIKTQCEKLKESASEGIRMIAEYLPEIEKEKDRLASEKSRPSKEFSQLKKWSRKRTKSTERLQKVQDEFNKLKLGLRGKNTVSLEDQTKNQSPVQPKDQEH